MAKRALNLLQAHDRVTLDHMRRVDVQGPKNWSVLIGFARRMGLTQREIANVFPCAVSTVSRWQAGTAIPPAFVRAGLKDLLLAAIEKKVGV
jgi:hypothetical protein